MCIKSKRFQFFWQMSNPLVRQNTEYWWLNTKTADCFNLIKQLQLKNMPKCQNNHFILIEKSNISGKKKLVFSYQYLVFGLFNGLDKRPKSSIRVNILGNLTRYLVKNFKDLRLYLLLCTQQAQFYRVDSQPEYFSYYLVILQI